MSAVAPAGAYVVIVVLLQVTLTERRREAAAAAVFAGCFAWGQHRIAGPPSWPLDHTAPALGGLVFALIVAEAYPRFRAAVAFVVLNIGCWVALAPMVASAPQASATQWILAQLALAFALVLAPQMSRAGYGFCVLGAAIGLGLMVHHFGSESLALTSTLLGTLTAGQMLLGHLGWIVDDYRTIAPAFCVLIALDLYNYVL